MTPLTTVNPIARILGGLLMNTSSRATSGRSPVLAVFGSLIAGAALAVALVLNVASTGTEPVVTGSVMFAIGLGWGLMAVLSSRFSAQPQAWAAVPAMSLGGIGLGLIVFQPGPAAMDLLSWIWPPALAVLAIWMIRQVRAQLRGRARWLVVPTIATLLVFAIGGGLTTLLAGTGSVVAGTTGRLIGVGGHRLYIECSGSGGPVVVLQSGLLESSSYWAGIAEATAKTTTVCAYDRAGHGRSDSVDGPQDGIALASDLHTLLERAGVAGPFVLVAHSSGASYVRVYASHYPDQVAGMVLLDPQPADAFTALPTFPGFYQTLRTAATLSPSLARVGLLGPLLGLPADQSTVFAARGARDEVLALPTVLHQAQASSNLGDRPLIVVTAASGMEPGWMPAQEEMASLSTNSLHRILASATHDSLITGVDAGASSQAILDVVASIRGGTALR